MKTIYVLKALGALSIASVVTLEVYKHKSIKKLKESQKDEVLGFMVIHNAITKADYISKRDKIKKEIQESIKGAEVLLYTDGFSEKTIGKVNINCTNALISGTSYLEKMNIDKIINTPIFIDVDVEIGVLKGIMDYLNGSKNTSSDKKEFRITIDNQNHVSSESISFNNRRIPKSKKEKQLKEYLDYLEGVLKHLKEKHNNAVTSKTPIRTLNDTYKKIGQVPYIDAIDNKYQFNEEVYSQLLTDRYSAKVGLYRQYIESVYKAVRNEYRAEKYGNDGERVVQKETANYDGCISFHSILIPAKDANGNKYKTEIDTLLITTRGVFVIETKNFGAERSYYINIDATGRWTTHYYNSEQTYVMENPNAQNGMHTQQLNKLFYEKLPKYSNLEGNGIIAIGNNKVDIIPISNSIHARNVMRADAIYTYIKNFPAVLSMEEVKEIARFIETIKLDEESMVPISSINQVVKENIDIMIRDLDDIAKSREALRTISNNYPKQIVIPGVGNNYTYFKHKKEVLKSEFQNSQKHKNKKISVRS